MRAADYKELRVYRLAFESGMEIFRMSRMNDATSWCGTGNELREVPPEYLVAERVKRADAPTL